MGCEATYQDHRPQKDRHALAWKQRDKLSAAWLLCLPGGGKTLSNEEFSTPAAVNFCLPPPSLAGRMGEPIRGQGVGSLLMNMGTSLGQVKIQKRSKFNVLTSFSHDTNTFKHPCKILSHLVESFRSLWNSIFFRPPL